MRKFALVSLWLLSSQLLPFSVLVTASCSCDPAPVCDASKFEAPGCNFLNQCDCVCDTSLCSQNTCTGTYEAKFKSCNKFYGCQCFCDDALCLAKKCNAAGQTASCDITSQNPYEYECSCFCDGDECDEHCAKAESKKGSCNLVTEECSCEACTNNPSDCAAIMATKLSLSAAQQECSTFSCKTDGSCDREMKPNGEACTSATGCIASLRKCTNGDCKCPPSGGGGAIVTRSPTNAPVGPASPPPPPNGKGNCHWFCWVHRLFEHGEAPDEPRECHWFCWVHRLFGHDEK